MDSEERNLTHAPDRGCVADQPQQPILQKYRVRNAPVLRLVCDTAAVLNSAPAFRSS
jgi:hypothetical protein